MAGNANSGRKGRSVKTAEPVAQSKTWTQKCPKWLSKEAKEYWDSIVPILEERNVLDDLDLAALEQLCTDYSQWRDCIVQIQKRGQFYDGSSDRGQPRLLPNPAVPQANQLKASMEKLRQKFGLTPKDRESIKAHKGRKTASIRSEY